MIREGLRDTRASRLVTKQFTRRTRVLLTVSFVFVAHVDALAVSCVAESPSSSLSLSLPAPSCSRVRQSRERERIYRKLFPLGLRLALAKGETCLNSWII